LRAANEKRLGTIRTVNVDARHGDCLRHFVQSAQRMRVEPLRSARPEGGLLCSRVCLCDFVASEHAYAHVDRVIVALSTRFKWRCVGWSKGDDLYRPGPFRDVS
jgi:hypothetical protein